MKSNNTFSIIFIIRLNKKDKSFALLYARILANGERTEISLKETIKTDEWDAPSARFYETGVDEFGFLKNLFHG